MKKFLIITGACVFVYFLFIQGRFGLNLFERIQGFQNGSDYYVQNPKITDENKLILPKSSIREIDDKKYVCIITKTIPTYYDHVGGSQHYGMKFGLKEVTTGPEHDLGVDLAVPWIEVLGLSSSDKIVLLNYKIYGPSGLHFNCGESL